MYIGYRNIDNDLVIENGDFAKGEVSQEHIQDYLTCNQGDIRQFPLVGINLVQYLNAPLNGFNAISLRKNIRLQLIAAKYTVRKIEITSIENFKIDAYK